MSRSVSEQVMGATDGMWRHSGALIATGFGVLAIAAILEQGHARDMLLLVGGVLVFLLTGIACARGWARWRHARDLAVFRTILEHSPEACWLSTGTGDIVHANPEAKTVFGALQDVPDMRALFGRLLAGHEDVVSTC